MKQKPKKTEKASGKKLIFLLLGVALVLIVLVVGVLLFLLNSLDTGGGEKQEVEAYLAENWTIFRVRSWDPDTGALELDYPLRFSYAQMEKYGGTMEELGDLPAGNLVTLTSLRTAAWEATGRTLGEITVYGLTNDNQIAYTVYPDGAVTACWDGQ